MKQLSLLLLLSLGIAGGCLAEEEARTALVVGVENYSDRYFTALGAPAADARALQAKLQALGFQAELLLNPTRRQLTEGVDAFGSTLARRGGIGLFYFSGHGAMKSDESANYLIPSGTNIRTENDLPEEAFNAQRIANRMKEAKNRLNLVFLDACRSHSLPRGDGAKSGGGGLAAMRGASGLVFFFATQPGEVAIEDATKRSLFTAALVKHLDSPGLSFMDMMGDVTEETEEASLKLSDKALRQSPFISGTFSGRFYFNPDASTPVKSMRNPAPPVEMAKLEPAKPILPAKQLVGQLGCWSYFESIRSPANKKFVADFHSWLQRATVPGIVKEGRVTYSPMVLSYDGVYLWKAAVEKAGSFDVDKVTAALESGVSFDGPGGRVTTQKNHYVTKNVFIGETKPDGQFKILKEYKDVYGEPFLKGTFRR